MSTSLDDKERLARKKAFFAELALLEDDDDEVDSAIQKSIDALKYRAPRANQPTASEVKTRDFAVNASPKDMSPLKMLGTSATPTPADPLRRAVGRSLLRSHTVPDPTAMETPFKTPVSLADVVTVIEDTPTRSPTIATQIPQLRTATSMPAILPTAVPKAANREPSVTGKRKRGEIRTVPLELQVFEGLRFFFIPNDDVAAARRLRIRKAIEYGATRVSIWSTAVTHVIVDKAVTYKDVLKYLKMTELPDNVILVNETYPPDCISYRALLPSDQIPYLVNGSEQAFKVPAPPAISRTPSTEMSQRSLQIKAVHRKEDVVVQARTPSRTDDSSLESFRKHAAELTQQSRAVASPSPETQRKESIAKEIGDPLAALFEQARAGIDDRSDSDDEDHIALSLRFIPSAPDDEDSDNNDDPLPSKSPTRLRKTSSTGSTTSNKGGKQTFSCMRGGTLGKTSDTPNPNSRTIEVLQQMATYYDSIRDNWRTRAYRQAISTLRIQPTRITTAAEAALLPNISSRIAAKIEEIVYTNRLRRLDSTKDEPTDQAIQLFAKIYGVGLAQASKWVQAGHRTLDDLKTAQVPLTTNQQIGIAHFDDFLLRIPRAEVALHGDIVRRALHAIDPGLEATVGGSYRRGALDSGDIDIVITKAGATARYLRTVVIETLVPELFKQGFLTAGLAETNKDSGSKWHGACQLPASHTSPGDSNTNTNPCRRIDLLLVPWDEIGAAMIYFTGNDIFNRSMRLLASKKGMRLNQRGLYRDVIRGKDRAKITEGVKVEGQDERRIFERLGVPWREAVDRNC